MSVSIGRPWVSAPVLSTTTALIRRRFSRCTPDLTRPPARSAAANPLTTVTGVEMTSAQTLTSMTNAL